MHTHRHPFHTDTHARKRYKVTVAFCVQCRFRATLGLLPLMRSMVSIQVHKEKPRRQISAERKAKTIELVPKWKPTLHKTHQNDPLRENIFPSEKGPPLCTFQVTVRSVIHEQMPSTNYSKIKLEGIWESMPNCCQIWAQINAIIGGKSMKQVIAKKDLIIMKKSVFQISKPSLGSTIR